LRRRIPSLKPAFVIGGLALAVILSAGVTTYLARQHQLSLPARIEISPATAKVFAGSSVPFAATLIGGDGTILPTGATPPPIRWSVVGPGTIAPDGVFTAGQQPSETAFVVARIGGVSKSVPVEISAPPGDVPLLLVACYEARLLDVRSLPAAQRNGVLLTPELPSGIAVDARRRLAFVSAKESVAAIDLSTMTTHQSEPLRGARFSGAALLAGGYFAATDNNAAKGSPGVYFFRIDETGRPVLAGSVAAGETPEGVVAQPDGRTFYVTNVNSNELIRYAFDGRGRARATGSVKTGTRPFGLAIDAGRRLLFVTNNDTPYLSHERSRPGLETFALPSLRRVGTPISTGSKDALPIGVAVDSRVGRLFVTNEGDANAVVFALPSMRRIATLPTGTFPWTPHVDELAGRLYIPSAHDDVIDVYDTRTLRRAGAALSTCSYPTNVGVAPRRSL
jgi:DNA-binding beta-propeller fold protein YncE